MPERDKPELDHVRDALRRHDARPGADEDEDNGPDAEQPEAEGEDDDEGE